MNRVAFKMKLKDGCFAEYKRRHDEIWPELRKLLSDVGISNYSIFLILKQISFSHIRKSQDQVGRRNWDQRK